MRLIKLSILLLLLACVGFISVCDDEKTLTSVPSFDYAQVQGLVYFSHNSVTECIGGAIITIGSEVDTSDGYGIFQLDSVPAGNQAYSCNHPDYDTVSGIVDIDSAIFTFDISLTPPPKLIDTLWIDEDATIKYGSFYSNYPYANTNFGSDGYLQISYLFGTYMVYDTMTGIPYTAEYDKSQRTMLKIPTTTFNKIDSAFLRLVHTSAPYYGSGSFRYMAVNANWFEDSIVWNNQPVTQSEYYEFSRPIPNDSLVWLIDITNYFDSSGTYYGLLLKYNLEFHMGYECYQQFYSSEHPTQANRPCVILYYSE